MREMELHINTSISKEKYPYAKFDFSAEEKVYLYFNPKNNAEINNGLVCSIDNQAPYFEIPLPFLNIIHENESYQLFMTGSFKGSIALYGKTYNDHVIIMTINKFKITRKFTTIDEMEPPF